MELYELIHKSRFTALLGKNGSGKSTILRKIKKVHSGSDLVKKTNESFKGVTESSAIVLSSSSF